MSEETYAVLHTNHGDIEIQLFANHAPKTVANFVELADGTKTGKRFYDGLIFHRVIPGFMIQGGCPQGIGIGDAGYKFADEFHGELSFNKPYLLAMANAGPNTNGSQFFITVAETSWLNRKHTIFGEVTKGSDVVDAIATTPTGAQDKPKTPVVIESVDIEKRTS